MNPKLIVIVASLFPLLSNANQLKVDAKQSETKSENLSSSINFEYSFIRLRLKHEETSIDSNYKSFNENSSFLQHRIGVGYHREFLTNSRFSLTLLTSVGISIGEDSKYGLESSNSIDSIDKVSGFYAGAGLSLNYNVFSRSGRTQVFISAQTVKSNNSYFLRYEDTDLELDSTEINYKEDLSILESSTGFRFFNKARNMMSTFALNFYSYNQNSIKAEARQGGSDFELDNLTSIQREAMSLKLGFGVLF